MKQTRSLINGLIACGVAFAMVTSLAAQEGSAKVVKVSGSARYMAPGSSMWEPLKSGTVLMQGAVVQTAGSGSYVDVVLNNQRASAAFGSSMVPVSSAQAGVVQQNAVRIFENSVLSFDKLMVTDTGAGMTSETSLDLKAGKVFGTVSKMSADSKYEVKIPNGVAGIRGTVYFISAEGVLNVISGEVVVAYMSNNNQPMTQSIMPGQSFDLRTLQIGSPTEKFMPGTHVVQLPTVILAVDHTINFVSGNVAGTTTPSMSTTGEE